MARTVARVDMEIQDNATWQDAFQFGLDGDTTWDLIGESFIMEVKGDRDSPIPLLTLSTGNGRIVVADVVLRVIYFDVEPADIRQNIPVQDDCYVYDLVMYNTDVPPRRVALMSGKVKVCQGVTED